MQQIHILQATEVRILHCNVSGKAVDVGDALDLGRVGVHELSNILERPDFKFLEVYAGLVKEWLTCTFGPASARAFPALPGSAQNAALCADHDEQTMVNCAVARVSASIRRLQHGSNAATPSRHLEPARKMLFYPRVGALGRDPTGTLNPP